MKNELISIDVEMSRQHALALANRATLVIVMTVWVGIVGSHFVMGTGWRMLAGVVPMIPLIWHGTYLHIKRSRRMAAARIDTDIQPGQSDRRYSAGQPKSSGGGTGLNPPDAPGSSLSLLLP